MTRSEYNQLLGQIPEETRKQYGFKEPFDLSGYKCIHTDEYDYYPELDCCMINDTPIVWEDEHPWVTPKNPEILKGFKNRLRDTNRVMRIVEVLPDGKILFHNWNNCEPHRTNARKKGYTSFVDTPEGKIYYNENQIDLPKYPETITLARCFLWAEMHNVIGIAPDKDEPIEEWMEIEFIPPKK